MNVKHFIDEKKLVFEITEELDHHMCEIVRRRADYEIQRFMPKVVVFDFDKVLFMDSAGIGLILGRYRKTIDFGGRMEIINAKSNVKKVFEMSGIPKIISVA